MMVNSKQLNSKLKSTPKMSLRNREVSTHDQSTPPSSTTNFNDEEFLEMIRRIVKEEIENHEEKIGKIIKGQLKNMSNRLRQNIARSSRHHKKFGIYARTI